MGDDRLVKISWFRYGLIAPLRDAEARNPRAISVRLGHELLDVALTYLKGKDGESEEAHEYANSSLAPYALKGSQRGRFHGCTEISRSRI
jgi:hypothetical protein